MVKEDEKTLK
jgi:hypothetical protein